MSRRISTYDPVYLLLKENKIIGYCYDKANFYQFMVNYIKRHPNTKVDIAYVTNVNDALYNETMQAEGREIIPTYFGMPMRIFETFVWDDYFQELYEKISNLQNLDKRKKEVYLRDYNAFLNYLGESRIQKLILHIPEDDELHYKYYERYKEYKDRVKEDLYTTIDDEGLLNAPYKTFLEYMKL